MSEQKQVKVDIQVEGYSVSQTFDTSRDEVCAWLRNSLENDKLDFISVVAPEQTTFVSKNYIKLIAVSECPIATPAS